MAEPPEEELDPRVEVELERLNSSSSDINKFEKELETIQKAFVDLSRQAGSQLSAYQKKLGVSVERARPYYQLKATLEQVQSGLCACAQEYEKYMMGLKAAEEMLQASEEKREESPSSETCKIMVNISKAKVATISEQLAAAKHAHSEKYNKVTEVNERLLQLKRDHTRHIRKSQPYFELYEKMCSTLEGKKSQLNRITTSLAQAKQTYSDALAALEMISNEIHRGRGDLKPDSAPSVGSECELAVQQKPDSYTSDTPLDSQTTAASRTCNADENLSERFPVATGFHTVNTSKSAMQLSSTEGRDDGRRMSRPLAIVSAIDPVTLGRLQSLDLPLQIEYSHAKRQSVVKTYSVDSNVKSVVALAPHKLIRSNTCDPDFGCLPISLSTPMESLESGADEEESICSADHSGSLSSMDEGVSMLKTAAM